jgi:hypothetical protein
MRDPLCVRMVSIGEKRCKRLTNMATFTAQSRLSGNQPQGQESQWPENPPCNPTANAEQVTTVPLENLEMSERKGIIFPRQLMGSVIPPTGPRGSNSWRPWLMLVNTIRMMQACQRSRDQTQIAKGQSVRWWVTWWIRILSGSPSFVAVVQSADLRHHHDEPRFRRLNRSWLW